MVRRTAPAGPRVADGARPGVPESAVGRLREGRRARPRGAVRRHPRADAALGGGSTAGPVLRNGPAGPRVGPLRGAGTGPARAVRRAVADPRPPADRRGAAGVVARDGRAAGVRGRAGPRTRRAAAPGHVDPACGPPAVEDRAHRTAGPDPPPVPAPRGPRTQPGAGPVGPPGQAPGPLPHPPGRPRLDGGGRPARAHAAARFHSRRTPNSGRAAPSWATACCG